MRGMIVILVRKHTMWEKSNRMRGVYTICTGMCGNGVRTEIIIPPLRLGSTGVDAGTTMRGTVVLRFATGTPPTAASRFLVFVFRGLALDSFGFLPLEALA